MATTKLGVNDLFKTNFKEVEVPSSNDHANVEGVTTLTPETIAKLKYPQWAPVWETAQTLAFKPPEPYKYVDRGYFGDPSFDSLFKDTGAKRKPITPKLGLEVEGIQLSGLSSKQKDDLALLVEQRGVVVFRNQDFKDQSFDFLKKWGEYFGPLHVHPVTGAPLGEPEFHLVLNEEPKDGEDVNFARRNSYITWHSDVSYENQSPGITALVMLQTGGGGDTQFVDTIEAYERLSPTLQKYLDGLHALHSSNKQIQGSLSRGGLQRLPIKNTIHPVVRYHPVLRKKALFINGTTSKNLASGFVDRILGLKDEESEALLGFLLNHIHSLLDAHIRASWDERTVVVWDNRRVVHSATVDLEPSSLRHGFRITPLAERPVANLEDYDAWTPEKEKELLRNTEDYLKLTPKQYHEKFYT